MSLKLVRGFALFIGLLPLSLLAHCGGNTSSAAGRADYNATLPDAGAEVIRTGIPDLGPTKPTECDPALLPVDVTVTHPFEDNTPDICASDAHPDDQPIYYAPQWFIFSDGTTRFVKPSLFEKRALLPPAPALPLPGWGIDAYAAIDAPGGPRCPGNNGLLRLWGGPFNLWGGGIGTGYINGQMGFDASAFDGVAFWARRGPEGQSTLRVNLIDEAISEEAAKGKYARGEPLQCQVAIKCGCNNGRPCTFNAQLNAHYCYDPAIDPPPNEPFVQPDRCSVDDDGDGAPDALPPVPTTQLCGPSACSNTAVDLNLSGIPTFRGACTTRIFETNLVGEFCGNPDQEVPEPTERCGNAYSVIVNVTEEWQLFLVPFEEMVLQDYAYKGPFLDKSAIWGLGFGWIGGWVDFYIDDVGFYTRR